MLSNVSREFSNVDGAPIEWSEYRRATVLFADLVDSVNLLGQLGEEKYQSLLAEFHNRLAAAVADQDGIVSQHFGDGGMCLFFNGLNYTAPGTRAILASLSLQSQFQKLSEQFGVTVKCSYGIATGRILVRDIQAIHGPSAIGQAINIAARLQANAPADHIWVAPKDNRPSVAAFHTTTVDSPNLKGFQSIQFVYQLDVNQPIPETVRLIKPKQYRKKTVQMIGRSAQIEFLQKIAEEDSQDGLYSVSITGQAGIGKSRLVQQLLETPNFRQASRLEFQCRKEEAGKDFHPIFNYLQLQAGIKLDDDIQTQMTKLRAVFAKTWTLSPSECDNMLFMMGYGDFVTIQDDPNLLRKWMFDQLGSVLKKLSETNRQVLIITEDIHWIDPSTAEFLTYITQHLSNFPVFLIATQRDNDVHGIPFHYDLALDPLSENEMVELVQIMNKSGRISDEMMDWITKMARGIPFYLNVILQEMDQFEHWFENNHADQPDVSSLFEARLDLLTLEAKRLVQSGSVFGRQFNYRLAAQLTGLDFNEFDEILQSLSNHQIIDFDRNREVATFVHDLVRDEIYHNLGDTLRRSLHQLAARSLQNISASDAIISTHFELADQIENAIIHKQRAALQSIRTGALKEATTLLKNALVLLEKLDNGLLKDQLELNLVKVQGPLEMIMGGPGSERFGRVQKRAFDLFTSLDQTQDAANVIYNIGLHAWAIGELEQSDERASQLMDMDMSRDENFLAAHTLTGLVNWHMGNIPKSTQHFDQTLSRYSADKHAPLYEMFLKDFGVFSLFYSALNAAFIDDHNTAQALAGRAHTLAEQLKFPHAMGFAMLSQFKTAMIADDPDRTCQHAWSAKSLAEKYNFPEFAAMANFALGWCDSKSSLTASQGVEKMQTGLDDLKKSGFICWQGFYAALLANGYTGLGDLTSARALIDHYLQLCLKNNETQFVPMLYLAQAQYFAALNKNNSVESALANASQYAEQNGAVLWQRKIAQQTY